MSTKPILVAALCASLLVASCGKAPPSPQPETAEARAPAKETPPAPSATTFDASRMTGHVTQSACFVTAFNGDPAPDLFHAAAGDRVGVSGWTADSDFNVPEQVSLILRRDPATAYEFRATLGPDAARAAEVLGKPQLANAGYTSEIALTGVQPGTYEIWISQLTGGTTKYCVVDKQRLLVGP